MIKKITFSLFTFKNEKSSKFLLCRHYVPVYFESFFYVKIKELQGLQLWPTVFVLVGNILLASTVTLFDDANWA